MTACSVIALINSLQEVKREFPLTYNNRTFKIIENSNTTIFTCRALALSDLKRTQLSSALCERRITAGVLGRPLRAITDP